MAKRKLLVFGKLLLRARRIFRLALLKSRPSWGLLKERVSKMTKISSLWPRRDCAMSQSPNSRKRFGLAALAVGALTALFQLSGCGGGGGGAPADPLGGGPAPVVVVSFTVDPGVIADEASTTSVMVKYQVTGASALTVSLGSDTKSLPTGSGEVSFTRTGVEDMSVSLKDKGVEIKTAVSKASCSSKALWDGPWTKCRVILGSYEDYVVAIWSLEGVPFKVTKTAVTPYVHNVPPWQLPTTGLFYCGLRKANNPDQWGYIHGSCQDSVTLKERPFMINPATGELTLSSPIDPYSPEYVVGDPADYRYADSYDPAYPDWSTKARVATGWFYTPGSGDDSPIRFRADSGIDSLIAPGTIVANGNVKLLQTFRHPK